LLKNKHQKWRYDCLNYKKAYFPGGAMKRSFAPVLSLPLALSLLAACNKSNNAEMASDQQNAATTPNVDGNSALQEQHVVNLPAGTPVTVRLQTPVSSAASQAGQIFDAVLDEPLVVEGQAIAPRGAAVRGKVTIARHSGRLRHPGELGLTLVSVSVGGQDVPVETSHIYAKGRSHKKRNFALIGGGTGAGALIGGIASGGTGALIGSAIGGGGGTAVAFETGKKDVGFGVERRLTFKLTQPLAIKVS
jgi:hypothetical protein